MSQRDFWTIYDDDSMEYAPVEEETMEPPRLEHILELNAGRNTIEEYFLRLDKRIKLKEAKNKNHFEEKDDLFEV